jgi:regulator of protease activity HflC (stomatin/prohibitin superfamily)
MESAFAWIGWIAEWLGSFVPRLKIVRSTHAGVKFRHGRKAISLPPGLHFYWPLVTEVEIIPVARQTHNLPSQCLLTQDGQQVVVGAVVVYSITNIVDALSKNWDVNDTINDITMVAITSVVSKRTLTDLKDNLDGDVQKHLTAETRKKLKRYGVKVFKTALTDFSTAFVIKNVGGSAAGYGALTTGGD